MRGMWIGKGLVLTSVAQMSVAAVQPVGQSTPMLASVLPMQSLLALLMVLALFFGCVWLLRRLAPNQGVVATDKLRVIGGVALGLREKVVLVQVGGKQLVLGVTPGRIETLTVLEGEECLVSASRDSAGTPSFKHLFKQVLQGSPRE